MNRTDRLYALVELLRASGPRGRSARQLAEHFEVSVRTIERDLSALGQAGVPLATKQGRAGGYSVDRSMSLPPLNFTPREAAAVAVALSQCELVLFARDARSALHKIAAAMPERALAEAYATAGKVRLIVEPSSQPDADVAEALWCAVRDGHTLRIGYTDVGGLETERVVEPQHVVLGPAGSYLTAWCHLRGDDRVFRMDRITRADRVPAVPRPARAPVMEARPVRMPHSVLHPEELLGRGGRSATVSKHLANSDTGLSRGRDTVGTASQTGG